MRYPKKTDLTQASSLTINDLTCPFEVDGNQCLVIAILFVTTDITNSATLKVEFGKTQFSRR